MSSATEKNLVRKYALLVFFVLAYVFFFVTLMVIGLFVFTVGISPFVLSWLIAIGSWTPNLAAFVVLWINKKPGEIRKLAAGWLKWRVHPGWYIFGIMPLVIALAVAGVSIALGNPAPGASAPLTATALFWMVVFNVIQGATGEELGWRGFALPRLHARYSFLVSAIILGLLIAGWHSILHLVNPLGVPEWQFWLAIVCYSVVVTWSFNRTEGSLLIVSLLHFSFNFGADLVMNGLGLVSVQNLFWGYTIVFPLWALGIILVEGKKFRQKPAIGV
jgi:membrane protease YdiL (CAAX protease family)